LQPERIVAGTTFKKRTRGGGAMTTHREITEQNAKRPKHQANCRRQRIEQTRPIKMPQKNKSITKLSNRSVDLGGSDLVATNEITKKTATRAKSRQSNHTRRKGPRAPLRFRTWGRAELVEGSPWNWGALKKNKWGIRTPTVGVLGWDQKQHQSK